MLPAAGTLVRVEASGIEDGVTNSRPTYNYFDPASSGISSSITVRFLLNKNSGMGRASANPRVTTNLFVNGSLAPLEFGFPPAMSSPMSMLNSTQYFRDVTFPAGTSTDLDYKYSGILDGGSKATGTNNYEAFEARWREHVEAMNPNPFVVAYTRLSVLAEGMVQLASTLSIREPSEATRICGRS